MLAVELLCTVRALRVRGFTLIGELGAALQRCATLPEGLRDRDISAELELAETVVESYAASAVAVRDPHGVRAS
jgi:histidine ammonia-lyase